MPSQSQNNLIPVYNNTGSTGLINPYLPTSQTPFQFWSRPVYTQSDGTYWAPGFDGPTFSTNPWDYVVVPVPYGPYIGGNPPDRTPGVSRVRVSKAYENDKKKPIGAHGARVTFHGIHVAEIEIEIEIWTPEQLRQLSTLWNYFFWPESNKGTSPPAMDVQHPLFKVHNIKAIQFVSGEGPEIGRDRRGVFRIRALEFNKPSTKSAVSTPVQPLGSLLDNTSGPNTPGMTASNLSATAH